MALNEGGMQYFIAGARANVGLKGGRHMFEATWCGDMALIESEGQDCGALSPHSASPSGVLEALELAQEVSNCRLKSLRPRDSRRPKTESEPRAVVRVGFSVAATSLILGESDLSVYFDSDGLFSCGKSKSPEKDARFARDQALTRSHKA